MIPAIFSVLGTQLSPEERAFFRESQPLGFILFNRNVETREQLRRLTDGLRECVGATRLPIMIDQEGGRVQMLARPPDGSMEAFADIIGRNVNAEFPLFPAPGIFGKLYRADAQAGVRAAHLNARLIAQELRACGVTVNCAPTLDVPVEGAHDIIGDRAFAGDVEAVIALGRAVCHGFRIEGIAPTIKHIPGHGKASADSHVARPRVTATLDALMQSDFAPFKALADAPFAMTAHIVYEAFDRELPATVSAETIRKGIRGHCGFQGALISDAIEMGALSGGIAERCAAAVEAGCDAALYCLGRVNHMEEIATALPRAPAETVERFERGMAWAAQRPAASDARAMRKELDGLMKHTN